MTDKTISRNYKICTLDRHLECSSCDIAEKVDCARHKPAQMARYYKMIAIYVTPAFLILGLASYILQKWWLVPAFIAYWIFYQITGELFIRCRHCPFWDESNPTLDCRINCGVTKMQWLTPKALVRYHPGPLQWWEKLLIQSLSLGTFLIPLAMAILALAKYTPSHGLSLFPIWLLIILLMLQLFTGFYFIRFLTRTLCKTCIHFSCPNNHQPYEIILKYLDKNEIMRAAWEKDIHHYSRRK